MVIIRERADTNGYEMTQVSWEYSVKSNEKKRIDIISSLRFKEELFRV